MLITDKKMLRKINTDWNCATDFGVDAILKNIFDFNNITYIEADITGAQLNADPYSYFAINRIISFKPINSYNKYSLFAFDCVLTIAKPADASMEVFDQYDKIVKPFLNPEFANVFRSYFSCCDLKLTINQIKPIYNSTSAVKNVNHSGVEITFTVEI